MTKLTILHFSDAHWHPSNDTDLSIVRDAMLEDLTTLQKQEALSVDLVMFTGDLVLAGENKEHFKLAHDAIISPTLHCLSLSEERFLICPGNHDISRKVVRESGFIEKGLKSNFISVEAANSFIESLVEESPSSSIALERMSNFESYVSGLGLKPTNEYGMVKTYHLSINGVNLGVACFDNSWRSSGESGGVDRNKLVLGERNVDFAIADLQSTDLAVAMFHHPISWLAEFDAASVSPRLHGSFDLLAFGHVHTAEPELKTTLNGSAILSQSGAFYNSRDYYNGYQIIEIDTAVCTAQMRLRTYFNRPVRRFGPAENLVKDGILKFKYDPRRGDINPGLEEFLREVRPEIRRLALDQFNISDIGADICSDPHTAFICPPIYVKSAETAKEEIEDNLNSEGGSGSDQRRKIDISEVLKSQDNYLFLGAREAGKSSLAHYISVLVAEGLSDHTRVPIVVDYKTFSANLYSLKKSAAAYLGISKAGFDIQDSLDAGHMIVIIDDFSGLDRKKKDNLEDLISKYPNTRWIVLADSRFGSTNPNTDDNDLLSGFQIAHIDTLPRRSIRELTRRWCEKTGTDDEQTFTTVMSQIRGSDLPRTGYIVTLLLWALHKNRQMERINEAVLIMNMSDYLLGKADFRKALEGEFDATSKEITLQAFSEFLRENNGYVTPNEATKFLIEFFGSRGLNYDAGKVLDALCECGILSRTTDTVKFKYRCFEEYFLAKHLGSSDARLKSALLQRKYLDYLREFEILSGLGRENDAIIDELTQQIGTFSPDVIENIDVADFEDLVEEESSVGISRRKLQKIRQKKLTAEQVDDLMDVTEARLAERKRLQDDSEEISHETAQDSEEAKFGSHSESHLVVHPDQQGHIKQPKLSAIAFMSSLGLLGRVLRNSEFTTKERKISGVKLYSHSSAKLFIYINEIVADVFAGMVVSLNEKEGEEFIDDEAKKAIRYFLTKKMMLFISSRMADELASVKLVPVFEELMRSDQLSLAEKTFLTGLQLDCPNETWDAHWKSHAHANKKQRIAIEFLVDKLWEHIHTKALGPKDRAKVEHAALEMEMALGQPKAAKGKILQGIRTAANRSARSSEKEE